MQGRFEPSFVDHDPVTTCVPPGCSVPASGGPSITRLPSTVTGGTHSQPSDPVMRNCASRIAARNSSAMPLATNLATDMGAS